MEEKEVGIVHLLKLPDGRYEAIAQGDEWRLSEREYIGVYNIEGGTGREFLEYLKKQIGSNATIMSQTKEQFESHVEKFNAQEQ